MNTFVGVHDGSSRRIAVVAARFNEVVTADWWKAPLPAW